MAQTKIPAIAQYLRRLVRVSSDDAVTDRELIARFVAERDEASFAGLVERHGGLVWSVCRRGLGNGPDAEDVFQATFLVLIRRAAAVRWQSSLAGWLFEVASRLAKETKAKASRRRFHERRARESVPSKDSDASIHELASLLDAEVKKLPAKYRDPCLLCYFEGRTADQASRQLGCSLRTVERRLAQARELLRRRLSRKDVSFSAGLLAAALVREHKLSPLVSGSTVRAAMSFAAGKLPPSAPAVALASTFLKGIAMARLTFIGLVALAAVAAVVTVGSDRFASAWQKPDQAPESKPVLSRAATASAPVDAASARTDAFAKRAWTIMDIIRRQHVEGVQRETMILGGLRALNKAAGQPEPGDEAKRRVAAVSTAEGFVNFIRANWPRTPVVKPAYKPDQPDEAAQVLIHDDKAPHDALEDAFLTGVLLSVPGTRVTPQVSLKEARVQEQINANRYVGIGIQLALTKDQQHQIIHAMPNGTARQGGIRAGDLIEEVAGKSTLKQPISQIVDWIRGEEGTTVKLKVRQPDAKESRTYDLKRSKVPFQHVFGYRRTSVDGWDYSVADGVPIAYLRVDSLVSSTLHELQQAERKIRAGGLQAVIVDLRESPGGALDCATLVADGLLDGGLMWKVSGAGPDVSREYRADRECVFRDWPMVVLINSRTKMGSALIAAALQDNKRAILIGEPTSTLGYVCSAVELPDEHLNVIVPTGRFERADRARGWPVKPDHPVAMELKQHRAIEEWHRKMFIAEGPTSETTKSLPDSQLDKAIEVLRDQLSRTQTSRPSANP
jgi:C-terminal peptidase prc